MTIKNSDQPDKIAVFNQPALPVTTAATVGAGFFCWAVFCYSVVAVPQTFDQPWYRLAVRILCTLVPALVVRFVIGRKPDKSSADQTGASRDFFCFRKRWLLGVIVGIVVSAVFLIVMWWDPMRQGLVPTGTLAVWGGLAAIPLVDEMLFRCVLAIQIYAISQTLDGAKGWDSWIAAVILSAVVFAAFDVPEWLTVDPFSLQLVVRLAAEFGLGCVLAVLFLSTRSVWASLIPHWVYAVFWQFSQST